MKFLSGNLDTPDELKNGEKKMVRARFKVDVEVWCHWLKLYKAGVTCLIKK